jgi:hypothetical protein
VFPLETGNNGKKQGENMDRKPWFKKHELSNPQLWVDGHTWRLEDRLTTIHQPELVASNRQWVTQNLSP